MTKKLYSLVLILCSFSLISCGSPSTNSNSEDNVQGDEQTQKDDTENKEGIAEADGDDMDDDKTIPAVDDPNQKQPIPEPIPTPEPPTQPTPVEEQPTTQPPTQSTQPVEPAPPESVEEEPVGGEPVEEEPLLNPIEDYFENLSPLHNSRSHDLNRNHDYIIFGSIEAPLYVDQNQNAGQNEFTEVSSGRVMAGHLLPPEITFCYEVSRINF